MDDVAVKELGTRIGKLEVAHEVAQALVIGRLDSLSVQLGEALVDMKANNKRIDDHETRISVRERAYEERILPALERLRNLELKVAGAAAVGGGVVYLATEIVKALTGG